MTAKQDRLTGFSERNAVMKKIIRLCICFLLSASFLCPAGTLAEPMNFSTFSAARKYVTENQPAELDLGETKFSPEQLVELKRMLPDGAVMTFSSKWGKAPYTSADTSLNLNVTTKQLTPDVVECLIELCPDLHEIHMAGHREMSNRQVIPLLEKYPDIEFTWLVNFASAYSVSSDATAYSTFKREKSGKELSSRDLEPLKYCRGLKALDLGHHAITDLDFLTYLPDLEFLILGDNDITDISPLAELPHLQYIEIFMNPITDVSPLAGHNELLDLNIVRTRVTDLSPLESCTALERLWCSFTKVPEDNVEHIRNALPGCIVNNTAQHSTADGWRDHPRYKQYIPQLKSHIWTGFTDAEQPGE